MAARVVHSRLPSHGGVVLYTSAEAAVFNLENKLNCEVLSDDLAFEVRWAVAGDSIVIQLVAKLEDGEYMSFGLSGEDERSAMVGGDVTVAWVDQNSLNGFAQDYFLDAKSQCAGTHGSCPDAAIEENAESVRLLNAALVNGYSIVTYQRPLKAHDGLDRPILTSRSQPVIWAVGPLNSKGQVSYHSVTSKGDIFLDFGRPPKWNCPIPQSDSTAEGSSAGPSASDSQRPATNSTQQSNHNHKSESDEKYKTPPPPAAAPPAKGAWDIPPIQCNEPEDGVFYAQMGPTGGKKGYQAITGHVGWGISYYINGLLIPEIYVVRGKSYTFVVEGGLDPEVPAKYHPFYITDDPVGGYMYKTPEERRKVNIYAGAELNKKGEVVATGVGRLCYWTPDPNEPQGDEFASFGAYQRTLTLVCDHGSPGVVQWTPDKDTPDTVYYQCFSHRYLGWKIHVLDSCDLPSPAGSEPQPSVVLPEGELQAKPSVQVTTKVKPEFPPQSLTASGPKVKNPTKQQFPYEFMKPPVDIKKKNEMEVKPVKEELEDIPESTTQRQMMRGNGTLLAGPGYGLMPGKTPMRVPYGDLRPPPTQRRPVQQQVVVVRRPPQPAPVHLKPQHVPMVHHQQRPVIVKKPFMKLPQRQPVLPLRPAPPVAPQSPNRPVLPPPPASSKPAYVQKFKKTPPSVSHFEKNKIKIQPSQMLSSNQEELTTKLPIAVNTGFNPGSLVIESGFKPIINTPQQTRAEERISEVEYDEEEGNDEGVIKLEALDEQKPNADEQKSQTEMFEPMFIPSPLDSNGKHNKKATTETLKKTRKPVRQVVVRRPVYEPLVRSEPDEVAMANEQMETIYKPKAPVSTYDGKKVKPGAAPPVPPAAVETGSVDVVKSSPQFGPFKGEVPPPVPDKVSTEGLPQLNTTAEEETTTAQDETPTGSRNRRSAHHEPGHEEPAPEPAAPEHGQQSTSAGPALSTTGSLALLAVLLITRH